MKTIQLYAPFEKVARQPDGSLLVNFTVTSEAVDDQDEIVDYDAVKKAAGDYMEWAALREMHQPSAVGTTLTLDADDTLRRVSGQGRVVDPMAILKVEEGVYKGVSMGGKKLATTMEKVGSKTVRRITDLEWTELSLVDRPSNPDAYLSLAKRNQKETEVADTKDEATAAAEVDPPETIAKSASDDLTAVHIAKERIAELIQSEAAEGDADQIAALQAALTALSTFEASEQLELAEPDNVAEAQEEEAEAEAQAEVIDEAYASAPVILAAAKTGDLAKAGARNAAKDQSVLDNILSELLFLGAQMPAADAADSAPSIADEPPAAATKVAGLSADAIAKAVSADFAKNAPFAKAADVSAIEERLLGLLEPMKEQLSKIAATPMPGGPVRFATPGWASEAPSSVSGAVSAELAKIADQTSDPKTREALQQQAAALDIKAAWGGRS